MKKEVRSFEDLEVYQKLLNLHLEVHHLTIGFPKHEMYELGSQLRGLPIQSLQISRRDGITGT